MTPQRPDPDHATSMPEGGASVSLRSVPLTSAAGQQWTVQALSGPVPRDRAETLRAGLPASVPGEVHADLLDAGEISDPFDGANESAVAWIGRTTWRYATTFEWSADGRNRQDLVFEGLDTIATVLLNGTELGRTANQHRSYRFDVGAVLVQGSNELVVELAAPVDAAERLAEETGPRPHVYPHAFNAIRKMAANYGWDWGPDLATVGIWRPLRLESWSGVRVASVRPLATVDGTNGVLTAHVDLEWEAETPGSATLTVHVGDARVEAEVPQGHSAAAVTATLDDVDLWWPRSHGAQPLYDVSLTLTAPGSSAGTPLDDWQGRVGFRTITVDTAPDEHGTPFVVHVNGRPVFVRGTNWIPDDALMSRRTRETYEQGVRDAVDANMNLLRVWGGGIYEDEDFYRTCDEVGVLVWQDFLFACATYSEEEPLYREVEAEAREAVTRLSQHASLAVWNGNNENIWGFVEWGWRVPLAGRTWGEGYYLELLPRIVAELDPRTFYSPASPYSFESYVHPNDPRHGTMHIWDVWNQVDYTTYRDYPARFVSEFGFQGPPAWSTLTSVVHDEPMDPYGPQMLVHQKAEEGNLKLERGLGEHLPRWTDIDGWHWVTQLNQARAIGYGIEHFRSLFPLNTGTVVWQLNDSWPVVSWAAVDAAGIRKPLWHVLRRVYADRLLTVQPRDGVPTLVVHNDSAEPWSVEIQVTRRSTRGGTPLAHESVAVDVPARSALPVAMPAAVLAVQDVTREFLLVTAPDVAPAHWYFVEDTRLQLAAPEEALEVSTIRSADGYAVTVTANALVKDVCLFPDRLDAAARVDTGMVTLAAGESWTFTVTSPGDLDEAALATAPVLRSVNDLVG